MQSKISQQSLLSASTNEVFQFESRMHTANEEHSLLIYDKVWVESSSCWITWVKWPWQCFRHFPNERTQNLSVGHRVSSVYKGMLSSRMRRQGRNRFKCRGLPTSENVWSDCKQFHWSVEVNKRVPLGNNNRPCSPVMFCQFDCVDCDLRLQMANAATLAFQ